MNTLNMKQNDKIEKKSKTNLVLNLVYMNPPSFQECGVTI